jgi:hypothetical protein
MGAGRETLGISRAPFGHQFSSLFLGNCSLQDVRRRGVEICNSASSGIKYVIDMLECCEALLVVTHQSTTRNILHDRRPQIHRGGNVKYRKHRTVQFTINVHTHTHTHTYIYMYILMVNYLMLHVLMKIWRDLPEDGDNAVICRS